MHLTCQSLCTFIIKVNVPNMFEVLTSSKLMYINIKKIIGCDLARHYQFYQLSRFIMQMKSRKKIFCVQNLKEVITKKILYFVSITTLSPPITSTFFITTFLKYGDPHHQLATLESKWRLHNQPRLQGDQYKKEARPILQNILSFLCTCCN